MKPWAAAAVVLLSACGRPSGPYAILETSKGRLVARLDERLAPTTVAHVTALASSGFYDRTIFHRVIPGVLIQGGDPTGTGEGDPGRPVPDEIGPDSRFDRPGLLGMASWGPGTSQTQFFITLSAQPDLDGRHTRFGELIEGLDVARAIAAVPRDEAGGRDRPLDPPKLLSFKVSRSRP